MRPLGLHQMNALELAPTELVPIAHEVGCQRVCFFVHVPDLKVPSGMPFEAVTPAMVPELLLRMDATGITVTNVEFFPLTEDVDLDSYRPSLEIGAQLGGERLVTVIFDTVQARATENLARLSDIAAEFGMKLGLEFMPLTPGCTSLDQAATMIQEAGRPNAGFCVDCLHLVRSGGTPEQVAALPTELFAYAQICDGPDMELRSDYWVEVFERMVPGEGVFPIAEIFNALPAGIPVDIEVPSLAAPKRGIHALDRARRSASAARGFLDRAQPTR